MYQFIVKVYKEGRLISKMLAIAPNSFLLWESATKRHGDCFVSVLRASK